LVCATLRVVVNCIVNDLIMVWDTLHNKKEKKHKGKTFDDFHNVVSSPFLH